MSVKITRKRGTKELTAAVRSATLAVLKENSGLIMTAVLDETPEGETGDLKGSLSMGAIGNYGKDRFFIRVLSSSAYFRAVITGHSGFDITPTNKKALAFMFPAGHGRGYGGTSVYKRVTIPPRKPNNFPKRAIRRVAPQLTKRAATTFITFVAR